MSSSSNSPDRPSRPTPPGLVSHVQAGDADAWNRLVDWAGPLVLYWCRRAGVPGQDVEDVFQDVFLAVADKVGQFRRDRPGDTFVGWLLTITRSKIADLARRRIRHPPAAGGSQAYDRLLSLAEQAPPDSDDPDPDSKGLRLRLALEAIRPEFEVRTWQAFWRTAVDGLPAPEAARELGQSPAAVRKAKSRVLARFREEFGELFS